MRGVKGWSALLDLDAFDPVTMIPVEIMHTFDLGIIKYFLKLWCDIRKTNKQKLQNDASISKWSFTEEQMSTLQQRMSNINVPHSISRKPKLEKREKWKADGKIN